MIKVAIFGGSFNPITKGHVQCAELVLSSCDIDEVWFNPCYNSLYGKSLLEADKRLHLCELALRNNPQLKVFDYEIKNKLQGSTYYFLNKLLNDPEYKNYNFSFMMGSDSANKFHTWVNAEALKSLIRFIILERNDITIDSWFFNKPHIYLKNPIPNISSTLARSLLANKDKKALDVLHENVYNHIVENALYLQ